MSDPRPVDKYIHWMKTISFSQIVWLEHSQIALRFWALRYFGRCLSSSLDVVSQVIKFHVKSFTQQFETWCEWAGDQFKGFQTQLYHLGIVENMNIEVCTCLAKWNDDAVSPKRSWILFWSLWQCESIVKPLKITSKITFNEHTNIFKNFPWFLWISIEILIHGHSLQLIAIDGHALAI